MKKKYYINLLAIVLLLTGCITLFAGCDDSIRVLSNKEKYVLEISKVIKVINASDNYSVMVISESAGATNTAELIVNGANEKYKSSGDDGVTVYYKLNEGNSVNYYAESVSGDTIKLAAIDKSEYDMAVAHCRDYYNYITDINFNDKQWVRQDNSLVNDLGRTISHDAGTVFMKWQNYRVNYCIAEKFSRPDELPLILYSDVWKKLIASPRLSVTTGSSEADYTIAAYIDDIDYIKAYSYDDSNHKEKAVYACDKYYACLTLIDDDQGITSAMTYNHLSVFPSNDIIRYDRIAESVLDELYEIESQYKLLNQVFIGNKYYDIITGTSVEYYNDSIVIQTYSLAGYNKTVITTDCDDIPFVSELKSKLDNPYNSKMIDIISSEQFYMSNATYGMTDRMVLANDYIRMTSDILDNINDSPTYKDLIYSRDKSNNIINYTSRNAMNGYSYEKKELGDYSVNAQYSTVLDEIIYILGLGYALDNLTYEWATDDNGDYQYARASYDYTPVQVEIRNQSIKIYSIWSDEASHMDYNTLMSHRWSKDDKYDGNVSDITLGIMTEQDRYVPVDSQTNLLHDFYYNTVNGSEASLEIDGDRYYYKEGQYALVQYKNDHDYLVIKVGENYKNYYQDKVDGEVVWVDSEKKMTVKKFNNAVASVKQLIYERTIAYYEQTLGLDFDGNNQIKFTYNDGVATSAYSLTLLDNYYKDILSSYEYANDRYIIKVQSDGHSSILKGYSDAQVVIDDILSIVSPIDYALGGQNSDIISKLRSSDLTVSINDNEGNTTVYKFADGYYEITTTSGSELYIYSDGVLKHYKNNVISSTISDDKDILDVTMRLMAVKHAAITFIAGSAYNANLAGTEYLVHSVTMIYDNKISVQINKTLASDNITAISAEVKSGKAAYKSVSVAFGVEKNDIINN